jgi:hypothetical protein
VGRSSSTTLLECCESWQRELAERSVVHSPIVESDSGWVLSFKDPDNVPLEFFLLKSGRS